MTREHVIGLWHKKRRLLGSAIVLLVVATYITLAQSPAIAEDANTCGGQMDNAHISQGAPGVIAKWKVHCNSGGRSVNGTLYLFRCDDQGDVIKDEDWMETGCALEGQTNVSISSMTAGTVYTRYVPPSAQPGASGTGWWIACAMWYSVGPAGVKGPHTNWSPSGVYLSYP